MRTRWQDEIEPGQSWSAGLKILGKAFLEPGVIAFFVIFLTMNLWLPPAAYYLAATSRLGSGPLVIWGVLALGLLLFLSGLGHFVCWTLKLLPYSKELKAAKRSGNKVRIDLALDAWRTWSGRRKFTALIAAMLSIFLIIPAWVALAKSPTSDTDASARAADRHPVTEASQRP